MAYQGGGGFDRGPKEMFKATCAECHKECDVPFKPSGDRPVYCKECFSKRKGNARFLGSLHFQINILFLILLQRL